MKYSKVIAAALTLVCVTSALEAKHHRQIVSFGNSESDCGNTTFGELSLPFIGLYANAESPYTNGAVWVKQLGNLWNTPVEASFKGGLAYGMAGAQTSTDTQVTPFADVLTPPPPFPVPGIPIPIATGVIYIPSMETQVNQFLTERKDVSKKAIIFHRGSFNDLFFDALAPPVDPEGDGLLAAVDTINNLATLKKAGYKNQVTFTTPVNFPNPIVVGLGSELFANTFNAALLAGLKSTNQHPVVIDINSFINDIVGNLPFYGFTGVGGNGVVPYIAPGLGPMSTLTGPNDTFFWFDGLHVSEAVQSLTSQYIFNILEAPECWGHLAAQPFAMMRNQNAVLRQELYPVAELCIDQLYPFMSGSYMPTESAPFAGGKAHDTSGWNGTFGFAYRPLKHWTVGVAGSYNQNSFEDHHKIGKCEADIHSWVVSLLSGFQKDRGYLNGFFNAGFVRFDDLERHFYVGPQNWKAKGDTHGMHYDVLFEGGWYFFRNADCQIGPIANIEYQTVSLNGYKEHHADYNNLQFKGQHNHSLVTGLGIETLIWNPWMHSCASGFTMKMFLSANEDWAGGTRHVKFRQRSLGDEAPYGRWPIYNKRTFFGSGGISVTNTFKNGVIFTVGYRGNWGQNHMNENSITANLSFPLWKTKKEEAPKVKAK